MTTCPSYYLFITQDACARFKAVKDKGYTSPSCLEEKAGAAVEGSDLRVLVEGMLAVCCPVRGNRPVDLCVGRIKSFLRQQEDCFSFHPNLGLEPYVCCNAAY
jgi:hypothetical protein